MKRNFYIFLKIGLSILVFLIVFYTEKQVTMREDNLTLALTLGFGFFLSLSSATKKYLVGLSVICFIIMVIFYLFWQIVLASLFGGIGLMYLIFYVFGNLKELIKKGYIQGKEI